MAKRKVFGIAKDLNEGISQTITTAKNNAGQLRYEVIPLVKIKFDENNPRKLAIKPNELINEDSLNQTDPLYDRKKKEFESLRSLANSIKKTGVRNAIEVYKDGIDYRLISGERRVLASMLAKKEDIPARVIDDKPSEFDIRYLQWIENIEREDLTIWERIQNVKQLITAYTHENKCAVTASLLKDIIGCSLPHAMTYLAILEAPSDIQELVRANALSNLEKVAFLAKISDSELRGKFAKLCLEENISLTTLKKMLAEGLQVKKVIQSLPRKGKGRAAKRVTLGYTDHIQVVKQLVELILAEPQFKSFATQIANVDWQDCSSISKNFQRLIKLMESKSVMG